MDRLAPQSHVTVLKVTFVHAGVLKIHLMIQQGRAGASRCGRGRQAGGRAGVVREAGRGRSAARHEVMSRGGVCITHLTDDKKSVLAAA